MFTSTIKSQGTLKGAFAQPITTNLPIPPKAQTFLVTVPTGLRPGDTFRATCGGRDQLFRVKQGQKSGDKLHYEIERTDKVFASTLPSIPGMQVVQAKPIIFGSVSHSFFGSSRGQQDMGKKVGSLMQEAQEEILSQAIAVGCNAVLGMTFNVTNDSSGDRGNYKMVIVTACGTPCSVVPVAATEMPVLAADVIVEPLHNF